MPIYEYKCEGCGLKFELLRLLSQVDEPANCPSCGALAKKLISLFSSFSKGEGGSFSPIAGSGLSCSSCSATTCSTCGQ